ncbi:MAG: molecular chaperone TorD family protein [Ardenticatenales bacterium]
MTARADGADLRLLARVWLAEPDDEVMAALRTAPAVAEHVPAAGGDAVRVDLAVAWLDLVSRHVPPHESVFIDPSAMLDAPATARFRATLAAAGWSPPPGLRVPAVDHLGVSLLALTELGDAGTPILTDHLLVWLPLFADAVAAAGPAVHPLYSAAARATLDAVLTLGDRLPLDRLPVRSGDVVPLLPPRPLYRSNDRGDGPAGPRLDDVAALDGRSADDAADNTSDDTSDKMFVDGVPGGASVRLRDVLDALLYAVDAGLYLGRADIAAVAAAVDLPLGLGDRRAMLRGLFESAGRYDAIVPLLDALDARWAAAGARYAAWREGHAAWAVYEAAWRARLDATRAALATWRAAAGDRP